MITVYVLRTFGGVLMISYMTPISFNATLPSTSFDATIPSTSFDETLP